MKKHHGGTEVKAGFYWSLGKWSIVPVTARERTLPGGPEHGYPKVPAALLLLLAPMMGGAYVIFLPFIGFAMVIACGARKGLHVLERTMTALVPAEARRKA